MACLIETILFPLICFLLVTTFAGHIVGENSDECRPSSCKRNGPTVRFPFKLRGRHPDHCGYGASFELSCSTTNDTVLELPVSVRLFVSKIDYKSQNLHVRDPNCCFAKQLHTLNLSTSPFQFVEQHDLKFTYFSCPKEQDSWRGSSFDFRAITCLDEDAAHQAVVSESWGNTDPYFLQYLVSCVKMYDVFSVPYDVIDSRQDIVLNWSSPECRNCEANGNVCGLKKNSSKPEIDCFKQPSGEFWKKVVTGGAVVGSFSLLLAAIVLYRVYRADRAEKANQMKIKKFLEDYKALKPTRYNYADIKRITDELKDELGQGAYGTVYKGKLSDEIIVAVKILSSSKGNGEEFINEVGIIGKIHHVNVVRLVGYCADGFTRALVYEYLPNNSLQKFISSADDKSCFLGWKKLQDIALGIAKGIEYLHQGCDQRILHFDIKPHNVLLDQNFNPKIADFGLAKLCSKDQSIVSMTTARGTMGYIAPEVFSRNFGNVSYKSDVYSFGMLLLEMVGGRKNVDVAAENSGEIYFPEWIYNLLENEEDLRIQIEEEGDTKIAKKLAIVGLKCIQWHPVDRPSMKTVVQMLEGEEANLSLPPNPFASSDTKSIPARNRPQELDVICESEQEIEGISELE